MKVCMIVWNHFTNDARVLREATALIEAGLEVDVIAVSDPKNESLPRFETKHGINIKRVRRYPYLLILIREIILLIKERKILWPILLAIFVMLLYLNFYFFLTILVILISLKIIKIEHIWVFFHVAWLMTWYGLKGKYDIYHMHDLNTLPQGVVCKLIKRKVLIYDSHEVQTSRSGYSGPWYGWLEKMMLKFVDVMIMTTTTRADYIYKLYKVQPKIVRNVSMMIDYDEIEPVDIHRKLSIDMDKEILLYQGGIQPGRGLDAVIRAMAMVEGGYLVLIGPTYQGYKPKMISLVKELGLEDKITFIDKVPLECLPNYTKSAYLGFQVLQNKNFNHYSALSNKIFEYMMMHIPVVACDFPEIKKLVEECDTGLVVDSHKPDEIAKAINTLINDKELRNRLSTNCIKAKEIHNWNNEKEKLYAIYRDLGILK